MMNDFPIASAETRRLHSKWVNKRDKWRNDYLEISNCIRATKSILRRFPDDRFAQITLRSLRGEAYRLMVDRQWICSFLRATSYPWAPREAVVRAKN